MAEAVKEACHPQRLQSLKVPQGFSARIPENRTGKRTVIPERCCSSRDIQYYSIHGTHSRIKDEQTGDPYATAAWN